MSDLALISRKRLRKTYESCSIWEKKYGKNANHKKKESEELKEVSKRGVGRRSEANPRQRSTRDLEKGSPRNAPVTKVAPQYQQNPDAGWGHRNLGVQSPFVKKREDEKALHPSWEAKRKLKEKESASIVPSQGKKIKFS